MGTARPGFWATADHEAAKVFGRRFWKAFIVFRIARRVWLPVLLLVFVAAVAGILWLAPPASVPGWFRIPKVPEWGWLVLGTAVLFGLSLFFRPVRFFWSDVRLRLFP